MSHPNPDSPSRWFKILCMVAVCRKSLEHWDTPGGDEWKRHVKAMISRFNYSTISAGLILTASAVLLSSEPPLARFIAYDTPAAYILAMIAFCTALLTVIFGTAILVMYESCTTHKDMNKLKNMPPWQKTCMLLWLAGPPTCMAISTVSLFTSIVIACFSSESTIVKIIAALVAFIFVVGGILTLGVAIVTDKWATDSKQSAR